MHLNLLLKILNIFMNEIIPKTRQGVSLGNKIFGGAILKRDDFSLVISECNNEIENPLWHGEIHTLNKYYELSESIRPSPKDCIFLSSHEPCSLCLSAITWAGFTEFYYLYSYNETASKYNIPHDLNILREVFNINDGNYRKHNSYWKSYYIIDLINNLSDDEKNIIKPLMKKIQNSYSQLSENYQSIKNSTNIPLK
tara:strand:- start:5160 stop:5750 length:591 start_codon:yes stop_codon:yes gene_type:complete